MERWEDDRMVACECKYEYYLKTKSHDSLKPWIVRFVMTSVNLFGHSSFLFLLPFCYLFSSLPSLYFHSKTLSPSLSPSITFFPSLFYYPFSFTFFSFLLTLYYYIFLLTFTIILFPLWWLISLYMNAYVQVTMKGSCVPIDIYTYDCLQDQVFREERKRISHSSDIKISGDKLNLRWLNET